jgi:hypothetical protein
LAGRWQTRPVDERAVSVFVPGSWRSKHIALQQASGRQADTQVQPGQWNTVETAGDTAGARLVASHPLRITSLEASSANRRSLAVRVRLAGPDEAGAGLLSIVLSLTDTGGQLVGGTELIIAAKTRDFSVELPLPARRGAYRLKASLCAGERVVDNARIDLSL